MDDGDLERVMWNSLILSLSLKKKEKEKNSVYLLEMVMFAI